MAEVVVSEEETEVVSETIEVVVLAEEVTADSDVSGVESVVASSVLRSEVVVVSGTDIDIGGFVSASMTETSFSEAVVTADGRVSSQSASFPPQPASSKADASSAAMIAVILFLFIITFSPSLIDPAENDRLSVKTHISGRMPPC